MTAPHDFKNKKANNPKGNPTGNQVEIKRISLMTTGTLLDYVLDHPDYLTDSYYADFGDAIRKRRKALKERFNTMKDQPNVVMGG